MSCSLVHPINPTHQGELAISYSNIPRLNELLVGGSTMAFLLGKLDNPAIHLTRLGRFLFNLVHRLASDQQTLCLKKDNHVSLVNSIIIEISSSIFRTLSGQLFTDEQVKSITSHAIGRYFTDWFPEPECDKKARERVEEAREHIGKASSIISAMQTDLDTQTAQLDHLLNEIEEKKKLAERYEELAETSQGKFSAFRLEMEDVLRKEIISQSEKGKRIRQVASFLVWLFTLVLGAALGTYFKDIVAWGNTFFS